MTAIARNRRLIVPRWRPLSKTLSAGELSRPVKLFVPSEISNDLRARLEAWRHEQNTVTASELVEIAIVDSQEREGETAARFLLDQRTTATPLVQKQARFLLARVGAKEILPNKANQIEQPFLATARRRTRDFPREPYAWVDLSLALINEGRRKKSERAMKVALQLAPYDRHVVRSASRLYLHLKDPERAHDLLKKNDATRTDPWLMAAEIAISSLAKRSPHNFKTGRELLDRADMQPRQLSELASAIATLHLKDGNRKARKLFDASLLDPTGNSLAQAQWASPFLGHVKMPSSPKLLRDSIEAEVFQSYWAGDLDAVITKCSDWHKDELFSSRPHQFGCSAAITTERYDVALKLTAEGLKINPDSQVLLNNRTYALIATGKFDDAVHLVMRCLHQFPEDARGPITATAGLLAMRLGQYEEGRKRYREAINFFRRSGNASLEALALAYFAQEVSRANLPDADEIIREAEDSAKKIKSLPELPIVLGRAKIWRAAIVQRGSQQ